MISTSKRPSWICDTPSSQPVVRVHFLYCFAKKRKKNATGGHSHQNPPQSEHPGVLWPPTGPIFCFARFNTSRRSDPERLCVSGLIWYLIWFDGALRQRFTVSAEKKQWIIRPSRCLPKFVYFSSCARKGRTGQVKGEYPLASFLIYNGRPPLLLIRVAYPFRSLIRPMYGCMYYVHVSPCHPPTVIPLIILVGRL